MRSKFVSLLCLVWTLSVCVGVTNASADISPQERQALIEFYVSSDGDHWRVNAGWKEEPLAPDGFAMPGTEKDWYGVSCNSANTRVVALQMQQQGITGADLNALSGLAYLRVLNLSDNAIEHNDYGFLGSLVRLRTLNLSSNLFASPIMQALSQLPELRKLDLSRNRLDFEDLALLSNLSNLSYLDLSDNRLNAVNPSFLSGLEQLEYLNLSNNLLGGSIYFTMPNLKVINLSHNDFELSDFSLANLQNLEYLDVSHNRHFRFSNDTAPAASQLKYLDLNHTTVASFPNIANLSQLEYVDFSHCGIADRSALDFHLSGLIALRHLDISHNRLQDDASSFFLGDDFGSLEFIDLSHNMFSWGGQVGFPGSAQLKHLDLSYNKISAFIDLTNNPLLQRLDVSHNAMNGAPLLGAHQALQYYDASYNLLPDGSFFLFYNASNLKHLNMSHNRIGAYDISPVILEDLTMLPNLEFLDLSHNQIHLNNLDRMAEFPSIKVLNLSYNLISGQLPPLDRLTELRVLNLSNNSLYGHVNLPENLERVYLSRNHFDVDTLNTILLSPSVKTLHMAGNAMTGPVPERIIYFDRLEALEIGYNGLYTNDANVAAFLSDRDSGWENTQTIAPVNITITRTGPETVVISWDVIAYDVGTGGYAVFVGDDPAGPFSLYGMTPDKLISEMEITGLESGRTYYFRVLTQSQPRFQSPNRLISDPVEMEYFVE